MANKIPLAVADFETQLSTALEVSDTTFSITTATDDDGVALPAGKYCFTVDNGKSNKEYLLGQLNGTDITAVVRVSRQGVETSGAGFAHRVGANIVITDFATIQRVADILRGQIDLDGSAPMSYDAEPTLADRKELATVGYVLDTVTGGTVAFDTQTVTGNAGATVAAGELLYFKTSDQEWYLTDADTASTVEGVLLGIALGAGSDGAGITNGVLVQGVYTTTGLTAGSEYYASNTAGAYSTSAGTTPVKIGIALSTTKLFVYPINPQTIVGSKTEALAGGSTFGTPSSTNKFITQSYNSSATGLPVVRTYLNAGSPHTWTKPAGLKYVIVEAVGGGGGGAGDNSGGKGGGGGAGFFRKLIAVASLGATETVTVGAGGAGGGVNVSGTTGGNTTFGSHATAVGGTGSLYTDGTGAAGGTATGGDINIQGQYGGNSGYDGNQGSSTYHNSQGGSSMFGMGSSFRATTGTGYGFGGYGGSADMTQSGGTGGNGLCIVTEYYS